MPVRDLPLDCIEGAETPEGLFAKLGRFALLAGVQHDRQLPVTGNPEAVALELGAQPPKLYRYITNLTGRSPMVAAPETTEALSALRRGQIRAALEPTKIIAERFADDPSAAAPKIVRLLWWPVRPKEIRSIT